MTRYKKYIKSKGFRLEDDYDRIPYPIDAYVSILGVICKIGTVPELTVVTNVDVSTIRFCRNGEIKEEQR